MDLTLRSTALHEAWSGKYPDFCERYSYDKKAKEWQRRKQIAGLGYIGRVYTKHPRAGEISTRTQAQKWQPVCFDPDDPRITALRHTRHLPGPGQRPWCAASL